MQGFFRFTLSSLFLTLCFAALTGAATLIGRGLPAQLLTFEARIEGIANVYLYDSGRGTTVNLTHDSLYAVGASWSPDGQRMLFVSPRSGRMAFYLYDLAAHRISYLLTPQIMGGGGQSDSEWSPDGRWLAVNLQSDPPYLYILNMTTSPVEMSRLNVLNTANDMTWAPDSTRVSISGYFNNGTQIVAYDVREGRFINLTWAQAAFTLDRNAVWSPDGTQIAFVRDQNGTQLVIMPADGTGDPLLPAVPVSTSVRPVWSPDSRWLLASVEGGLARVDAQTGDFTLLAADGELHAHQLFTPDGSAFIDTRYSASAGWRLYWTHVDGSESRLLPVTAANALIPQWGPQWPPEGR
ncbi:MAG: hypothetical protein U0670_18945 [Anaerolineae bacterium]